MNDIQYIVDDKGTKRAVIIDLDKFRDLWEDFYDSLIARSRADELRESLNTVKKHLSRAGKLNG
jgi:PHD/YefM family antitoxin component YafN of YafNO toxin-antitoxin module